MSRPEPWTQERFAQKNADRRRCRGAAHTRERRLYLSARRMRRADSYDGAFGKLANPTWNRLISGTLGVPRGGGRTDDEEDG